MATHAGHASGLVANVGPAEAMIDAVLLVQRRGASERTQLYKREIRQDAVVARVAPQMSELCVWFQLALSLAHALFASFSYFGVWVQSHARRRSTPA
eukprot:m.482455 g.482455  ORF g.482455 m.482455 type:complete len:97 (-) comp22548_c0_seq1:1822-2112(-)